LSEPGVYTLAATLKKKLLPSGAKLDIWVQRLRKRIRNGRTKRDRDGNLMKSKLCSIGTLLEASENREKDSEKTGITRKKEWGKGGDFTSVWGL